jgi:hypothetical protein
MTGNHSDVYEVKASRDYVSHLYPAALSAHDLSNFLLLLTPRLMRVRLIHYFTRELFYTKNKPTIVNRQRI